MWIGNKEIKSPIIIAPMAGISNDAFIQLCFEFEAGLAYGEMVSDKAIFYKNVRTLKMLEFSQENHPLSLQLFGSDITTMVYAAKYIDQKTDCDFIDINMGCPVNKVVKTGAGSAMMKDEDNTVRIVKKIVESVSKPVTVKMRLGYDNQHLNYLSLSKKLEDVGVSAIALHARTRTQMYSGKADWSHIRILKDNLSIPVFGNGDVKTVEDFDRMRQKTGCDGVMIARGLVGNPFLIKKIADHLQGKENSELSYNDKLDYCLKHAEKLKKLKGEKIAVSEMRGIAVHYLAGMYNSTSYKEKINRMRSYDELCGIVEEFRKELNDYYLNKDQII